MKKYQVITIAIIIATIAISSCKDGAVPEVSTSDISEITRNSAICGGNVISDGGSEVTLRGVCWSKNEQPTLSNAMHSEDGTGTGNFSSNLSALAPGTTYYVRAFAVNKYGIGYGEVKQFNTSVYLPEVTTSQPKNITDISAKCGGSITNYYDKVTAKGVCWSTSPNPTIADNKTNEGEGNETFISELTGLTATTTYYVRAYATTDTKTKYGEEKTFTTAVPFENKTFTVNGVNFKMIAVRGGTFQMGSTNGYNDEQPIHSVTLSGYYIGETEVTQALWKAVMGSWPGTSPSSTYGLGNNYPAYNVSWDDCLHFIAQLNQLTGKTFRLPTEAEWEFAARGGNKSNGYTYSGSNSVGYVAWYSDNSSSKTHIVKGKAANELGIYDMSGNVWEWCQDWYGSYSSSAQTNPTGPTSGSYRVHRGGSWDYFASNCRVANRYDYSPGIRGNNLGFRLVLVQ